MNKTLSLFIYTLNVQIKPEAAVKVILPHHAPVITFYRNI